MTSANNLTLRLVRLSDAEPIRNIYAPYVTETTISFETEAPSVAEIKRRIEAISARYPYLVCQDQNGRIIGYTYAHAHQERAAYQWNAESAIYLDRQFTGAGTGKILYGALMEILIKQNIHNLYAVVASPNPPSRRFHERLGFAPAGVLRRTGYKFDQWLDVGWYEKRLIDHGGPPQAVKSIHDLDPQELQALLEKFSG